MGTAILLADGDRYVTACRKLSFLWHSCHSNVPSLTELESRVRRIWPRPEESPENALRWLVLLAEWNKRIDLTAARTDDELVDLMLGDAIALHPHIPENAHVVDVGTGAGAPGLALALLRPDLKLTLVEPLVKRVSFLRTVVGTIGRLDITVLSKKGEDVVGTAFDVAMSRATLPPPLWVPLGLSLAPSTWLLLARESPPEIADARIEQDFTYTWPLTNASRRAVRFGR